MFTTKQRAYLRALANAIEPSMQIGKEGLSDNVYTTLSAQLEARELVKVKVLKNCDLSPREVCDMCVKELECNPVQVIGNIFVVYKKSTKKGFKHIELP